MEKMVKPKEQPVYPDMDKCGAPTADAHAQETDRLSSELKKTETLLKRTKTISAQRLEEIKSLKETAAAEKIRLMEEVKKTGAVYDSLQEDYNKLIEEKAEIQSAYERVKNEAAAAKDSLN
ncbi:MAG: hypothetical protein FWE78_01945, partial [Methanimicrococcus sp.]|nr:hypothetical protein [Methanimicrococcus sp.]